MNTIGKIIRATIFGESHGEQIGITISGLPSGISFDFKQISDDLKLRQSDGTIGTQRQEKDAFEVVSGYFNNYTTGTPLTLLIKNTDYRPSDYKTTSFKPRPSHIDFGAFLKYGLFYDFRGGGHASGRLTSLLVILGSIARQILAKKNIQVVSHVYSLQDITDEPLNRKEITPKLYQRLSSDSFPVIDEDKKTQMMTLLTETRSKKDTLGGVIETGCYNMPTALGEPFFNSVESFIARLVFAIPGVKGVEFGEGFNITKLYGSVANDEYIIENNKITTKTFNNGGIVGGISTGAPLIFRTAFKPPSSIFQTQQTVNLSNLQPEQLTISGRHDTAIVTRASIIMNAITYYAILELMAQKDGTQWMN